MQGLLNQIAALNKTSFEAALDATLLVAEGATKLGRLQLEAAKVLFQEAFEPRARWLQHRASRI